MAWYLGGILFAAAAGAWVYAVYRLGYHMGQFDAGLKHVDRGLKSLSEGCEKVDRDLAAVQRACASVQRALATPPSEPGA